MIKESLRTPIRQMEFSLQFSVLHWKFLVGYWIFLFGWVAGIDQREPPAIAASGGSAALRLQPPDHSLVVSDFVIRISFDI